MSANGFKIQLKDVLSRAVSYFQDTGDPNGACIKAANELGLNADQADRLVETFNTARVICHYKAAEDKASSCSLADKDTVRGSLTPQATEVKESEYDTADYGCYKQAEVDYVVPEVKMAGFTVREDPISKEASDWLAIRELTALQECIKTAEEEARAANAMADMLAEKAAMALSRNVSIDDVHDRVARIVTAYAMDDRYAPGVEKVAEFLPAASDPDIGLLRKYASMHVIDTSDIDGIMGAIKEAADFAAESAALMAYAGEMKRAAQGAPDPLDTASKDELDEILLRERIRSERHRRTAPAAGGGGGSSSGGGSYVDLKGFTTYVGDTLRDQYGRAYDKAVTEATDSVNNLRRQLILQDLLVRDKVLSQEDPNAVVAAFRSVNQVSPDTTLNKEILRSMLRSAVQSVAISPYDAKTLADVDKARHQAYDSKATGGKSDD